MAHHQDRREFLENLGVASAAVLGKRALPLNAAVVPPPRLAGEPWDMSWLDRVKSATYRAVIDAILLVCNIALNNWARGLAERTSRDVEEVKKEVFANLVPGTTVMPSGVFAIMRAQNAGCAYMRGQ